MRQITTVLCAVLLCGCAASMPADPGRMTPEQLAAVARERNASVACTSGKTTVGSVTSVYVNADQARHLGSKVTVKPDCETVIEATSVEPAPAPPVAGVLSK